MVEWNSGCPNVEPLAEGSRWQHYKGGFYRVVTVGKREADLTPVVVYAAEQDGSVWVRPLDEWRDRIATVTDDGRFEVSRFTPIGESCAEMPLPEPPLSATIDLEPEVERILSMSDQEILYELLAEGKDLEAEADKIRQIFEGVVARLKEPPR